GGCKHCKDAVTCITKLAVDDGLRFGALQSDIGKKLLTGHIIDSTKVDSIVLIDGDRHYIKSSAALNIARHLSGGYPLLYGFMVLPRFIRDWIYDLIANNRYKWFGKRDSCMVPTPQLQAKFLHK